MCAFEILIKCSRSGTCASTENMCFGFCQFHPLALLYLYLDAFGYICAYMCSRLLTMAPYGPETPHAAYFFRFNFHFIANVIRINCVQRNRLLAVFPDEIVKFGAHFFPPLVWFSEPLINRIHLNGNCEKNPNEYWRWVFMRKENDFFFFTFAVNLKWFSIFNRHVPDSDVLLRM